MQVSEREALADMLATCWSHRRERARPPWREASSLHLDVDGQGLAVRAEGHRRDEAVAAGEVLVVAGTLQGLVKALGSDLEHGEVAGVAVLVGPYFGGRQRPSTLLPRWSMGWVKNGVASRRGDGVDAGAGVTFQGPDGGVPGSGKQSGRVGAVLCLVGERGVPELVQRPAAAQFEFGCVDDAGVGQGPGERLEQLGGAPVGQPPASGDLPAGGRFAVGEEDRASSAAPEQAGQQLGGARLPVHPVAS
ncbi:hypothetical protein [Nonomuraea sp. NPDC049607]|uniref:hypothetical protein n=1 Tax=Nonomuraea sp. NPDC049607 TaxID=3154732 RepID=UPI0034414F48